MLHIAKGDAISRGVIFGSLAIERHARMMVGMTTKTILELFENKIVPRLKEELHIALRGVRHDLSELEETLRILGDRIDDLNRPDPEDDIAEEDNG